MSIQKALFFLCMLILLWLPLPLGSNRPWAITLAELSIFVTAGLTAIAWSFGWVKFIGDRRAFWLCFGVWALWLSWVALTLLTVEQQWWQSFPDIRLAQLNALEQLGMGQAKQASLSIAADITYAHWLESAAYATLFLMVFVLAGGRREFLRSFLWVILLSAVAQAVYGSFMLMSGINANLFGPKLHYLTSATGTYVNRNHFAGYLQFGLAAAVGLSLIYAGPGFGRSWRLRLINKLRQAGVKTLLVQFCGVILIIGLVLSLSRMGSAAALGGFSLAIGLYLLARRGSGWYRVLPIVFCILLVDMWIVGNWFNLENLKLRIESTDLSTTTRSTYYPALKSMTKAYLPTGAGLGTFEVAYPQFASLGTRGRLRHAHNDYYQFAIETGLPGIVIMAIFLFVSVRHYLKVLYKRNDPVYLGVAVSSTMAMCCVALHSLTDFNLQIPANAATLVAMMAVGWCCNPNSRRQQMHNS